MERIAFITGSARRVGRAIAARLVRDGWRVIVHARDDGAARQAAAELGALGSTAGDLGDRAAVERIAQDVLTMLGAEPSLNLLVNNASSFERVDDWAAVDAASWDRSMNVIARAPYLLTTALLPALARARGCVINIGDRAAHEHWTHYPGHAAAKAALHSLTMSGAAALAPRGVRMHIVTPGTILPPDEWDAARIERERATGRTESLDALLDDIAELARAHATER